MSTPVFQKVLRSSSFQAQLAITMVTNVYAAAQGLLTGVLVARLLGPQGRGELAAIQTLPNLAATIGVLGLTDALVFFAARQRENVGQVVSSAIVLALIVSTPAACIGFLAMPWLLQAQAPEVVKSARVFLLMVPLNSTMGMLTHPVRGLGEMRRWNVMRILPGFAWLMVLAISWLLHSNSPHVLAYAYLGVFALLAVPLLIIARPMIHPPYQVLPSLWPRLLRYGVPSALSTLPSLLNLRLDQMLMAALFPPSLLGLYAVGVSWSGMLHPILGAISGVLMPHVASAHGTQMEQLERLAYGCRLAVMVTLLGLGLLAAITPLGLPAVFGRDFVPVVYPTLILVWAAAFTGVNSVLASGVRGLGHPAWCLYAEVAGLVATVVTLAALFQRYQLIAAALASLVSYMMIFFALVFQVQRFTPLKARDFLVPRRHEVVAIISRLWLAGRHQ